MVFLPLTFMVNFTINLMNESYHECERNEHHSSCSKVPKNYSETTWALASIYYFRLRP